MQHNTRDTMLLSGWLFADIFLALMIIFLSSVRGTVSSIPYTAPPRLTVTPTHLSMGNQPCIGDIHKPLCKIEISEAAESRGAIDWTISSYMDTQVHFHPGNGILSPGQSTTITIDAIPCHNGTFTISGSRGVYPVQISWQCIPPRESPPQERLDFTTRRLTIQVPNISDPLTTDNKDSIKQQVRNWKVLQRHDVGFAIVYDGAPTTNDTSQALDIAKQVYGILKDLGNNGFVFRRAAYYDQSPLYRLGDSLSTITIDVYLFAS